MKIQPNTRTVDCKISELCNEVDAWKSEAEYWKDKYEEEAQLNNKHRNESIERVNKGLANALILTMSLKEGENGSIKIEKEDRKYIAENWNL